MRCQGLPWVCRLLSSLHLQFLLPSSTSYDLTKKMTKWHWDELEDGSFILLKAKFFKAPILIQPNVQQLFRLECDTSKKACGAILSQKGEDSLWHPVAFMSKA